MKKFVSTLFLLVLLLNTCAAFAELDLSLYSNDELIALETAIQAEKIERGIAKSATLYAGVYVIGEDIPAGVYSIETLKGVADHLYIYDETGRQVASYAIGTASDRSPIGRVELKEHYTIEFDSCTILITVYAGGIVFQ